MQLYVPSLKEIGPVFHEICVPENCPIFFTFFFFALFYKNNFEPTNDTLLVDQFLTNLAHLRIRHFVAYIILKFGDV